MDNTTGDALPAIEAFPFAKNAREKYENIIDDVVFSVFEVGAMEKTWIDPYPVQTAMCEMDDFFSHRPDVDFIPIHNEGVIVGYIKRDRFQAFLGQGKFHRDLYLRKNITIEKMVNYNVVVLQSRATLDEASKILMNREADLLYDNFVVMHYEHYFGVCSVKAVMDGLNKHRDRNMFACASAQEAIMKPDGSFRPEKLRVYHLLMQKDNLGGDIVYFDSLMKHIHLICLMDVCGKGLKASNMVMAIMSALKTSAHLFKMVKKSKLKVNKIINRMIDTLNKIIADGTSFDMYATGLFLIYDSQNQVMDYYNYGHTPLYMIRDQRLFRVKDPLERQANAIPFFGFDPELCLKPGRIKIKSKDKFFVHSDGLNEARNENGEEYGQERLQDLLKKNAHLSAQQLVQTVKTDLDDYRQGARILDDLSLASIKIL